MRRSIPSAISEIVRAERWDTLSQKRRSIGRSRFLVSGPTQLRAPANCELIPVITADEMRAAVLSRLDQVSIVIKAAAVADYRPVIKAEQKIKRTGPITIELTPTEDILAEVVRLRKAGTMVIGFAAETENTLENGRVKLLRKGVDAIVLNDVARPGLGFDSDRNAATFLTVQTAIELPEMSKRLLAERILDEILALRRPLSVITETDAHVSRQD